MFLNLPQEEMDSYDELVKRLEMRYGHAYLEQVYQSQFKNRRQRAGESLQEFEVDVARLVRFAYPTALENVMECFAVPTFVDEVKDDETRRALRLARLKALFDALATALDFEAAKEASRGNVKVRAVACEENEINHKIERLTEQVNKITGLLSDRKQVTICWNCGEQGHYRRNCKRPTRVSPKESRKQEN